MTDEPEGQGAAGAGHRYPCGLDPRSLANLKPPWKPGQSGNPSGRPKGFQLPAKRLQNLVGSEEGWAEMEPELLEIMRGEGDAKDENGRANLLRFLGLALQNDHALLKSRENDEDRAEQPASFVVRAPEETEGEGSADDAP